MLTQLGKTSSVRFVPSGASTLYYVEEVAQELADVRSYRVRVDSANFRFIPGQYIVVSLPEFSLQGALNLSSSPYDRDHFTVTVKRTGTFGTTFYDHVNDGSPILASKPVGSFCIAEEGHRPVCFIGRDYGITAARSFARYFSMEPGKRLFTLIHEVSNINNGLFDREFHGSIYAWMKRSMYLDSAETPSHWTGSIGAVNPFVVLNEVPDFLDTEFYVAGEGKDVRRLRGVLRELNIPLQQIHTEKWS
jgi:ferredoxin-NADP reductase